MALSLAEATGLSLAYPVVDGGVGSGGVFSVTNAPAVPTTGYHG